MRMKLLGLMLAMSTVAIFATPVGSIPPCVPDTLSNYQDLGASGCSIGQYSFNSFSFADQSSSSGGLTNMDITVTPMTSGTQMGLTFSGNFAVFPGTSYQYEIDYVIDPPPPILRFTSEMNAPTDIITEAVNSFLEIDTTNCVGSSAANCVVQPTLVVTGNDPLNAQVFSPGGNYVGVTNTIKLNPNGNTGGQFDGFTQLADTAPEPSTFVMLGIGVLGLAFARRVNARRRAS